jgi:alpha-L-fucosidase
MVSGKLFQERRFGLFVHWGIYAIPAWHEQVQWRLPIDKQDYVRLAKQFRPDRFSPDAWLDLAEAAGMQYLCFTTKHHDGFCMWDTAFTDYSIMHTPYGRDVLKMLAEACARRDFGLCLYYSIPDWNHPNAPKGGSHELPKPNPGDEPDEDRYIEYVRSQVRELCSNYGQILGFFWDIPPRRPEPSLNRLIRELQPGIMINDRGYDKGDYDTPERSVPEGKRFPRATEANQSVGRQSWGYRSGEDYYSHKLLMRSIDKIMAMGGNYLLNVGPQADGTIPPESEHSVRRVGDWFLKVREALTAEPASDLLKRDDIMLTRRDNTLYVHFHNDPDSCGLHLDPLAELPRRAVVLNTGRELGFSIEKVPTLSVPPHIHRPCLHLRGIPANELTGDIIVLKLEFEDLDRVLQAAAAGKTMEEYRF